MSYREVARRGSEFLKPYETNSVLRRFGRKAAFMATGWFARSMLNNAYKPSVTNLDILLEAHRTSKIENRGLITVMNHTSVLDEPLCWGMLPWEHLMYPKHMRWTLGADNICFKNRFVASYFSLGQVLSTKRYGAGIFQGSIDAAISLLSPDADTYSPNVDARLSSRTPSASWVHMFPEAVVHQPEAPHNNTLRYFHWGVSRLVLESTTPPIVVPIFTKGLEKSMPEDKPSMFPRTGMDVQFNVGDPMKDDLTIAFRNQWLDLVERHGGSLSGDMPEELRIGQEAKELRSKVASAVRDSVLAAREPLDLPEDDLRFNDPAFWHLSDGEKGVSVKTNRVGSRV